MKKKIGRDGDKSLESGANSRVSTLCCLQTTSHLYPRKQQCCTATVHIKERKKTREKRKLKKARRPRTRCGSHSSDRHGKEERENERKRAKNILTRTYKEKYKIHFIIETLTGTLPSFYHI